MRISVLAIALLLPVFADAAAAASKKKKSKAESTAPAEPETKEEPAPAPEPTRAREEPAPKLDNVWSLHGGATLNGGGGLRADAFGSNHTFGDGYGYGGIDAMYFVGGTGRNVDLGFGLRFGAWPLGFAPQAELRFRLAQSGLFHFGLFIGVSAPLAFRGMIGGFTYAAQAEPGVLMSFFLNDHIEIFINVSATGTLLFSGLVIPVPQVGFTGRVGFAYTFLKPGIGIVFSPEVTPGLYAPFGAPTVVNQISTSRVAAGFLVAFMFKLGIQVRF